MGREFYSLRMRSSAGDKHISGAERLLEFPQLEAAASNMLSRALNHPRGTAEKISFNFQPIPDANIRREPLLNLSTVTVGDWRQGRLAACHLLEDLGLKPELVHRAMAQLAEGPAPGGQTMRGAMLIDVDTGQRLETDWSRGVRVSRMDVDSVARPAIELILATLSLDSPRVIEAWVLASKIAIYPQIVAELCWSDDPDYLTGYVASSTNGYQRITHLKPLGSELGGRIFFVKPEVDLPDLIERLQFEPVLFGPPVMETS